MRLVTTLLAWLLALATPLGALGWARAAHAAPEDTWIVVPAPAFADVVKPLEAQRRAAGYRVVRIGVDPEHADAATLARLVHAAVRAAGGTARVLLVGAVGAEGEDASVVVPAFPGSVERMQGQPTDNPYGSLDDDRTPEVAVGRFPVRTVDEARAMVEKTIRFESSEARRRGRFDIGLVVGHPGGNSALEKRFASSFVLGEIVPRFRGAHPRWRTQAIVHMDESPFTVPDERLDAMTLDLLRGDQVLTVFLGHSAPRGLWSQGRDFAVGEAWDVWDEDTEPRGVLLSCGCYTCQLAGFGGHGYGLRSVRSPGGHVAVVGAHQVSYGVMGKLAFGGLVPLLEAEAAPTVLGDWFLAMKRGLAEGNVGWLSFKLYDQADGSGGKTPLAVQREEHLEMWMLLGDPALALPLEPSGIELVVEGPARAGEPLHVRGKLPEGLALAGPVILTVERPFGELPPDAVEVPFERGSERDDALLLRHRQANDPVLLRHAVAGTEGRFEASLVLPEALAHDRLRVRVSVSTPEVHASEARWVDVQAP